MTKSHDQKTKAERDAELQSLVDGIMASPQPDGINDKGELFKGSLSANRQETRDQRLCEDMIATQRQRTKSLAGKGRGPASNVQLAATYLDIMNALQHRLRKQDRTYEHLPSLLAKGDLSYVGGSVQVLAQLLPKSRNPSKKDEPRNRRYQSIMKLP